MTEEDEQDLKAMTDEELEQFLTDSVATLRILNDKRSPHFEKVVSNYVEDLSFLLSIGRISEEDYNELTEPDNLRF